MSLRHLIVTLGIVLAVAAPATLAEAAPARPVSPDAGFLIAAHQGNLAQVKLGRLAARKGATATVRDLGRRLATYHRELDIAVRKAATGLDVDLPGAPNSAQKSLLGKHRAATGAEFDRLFVDSQLLAHEQAGKLTRIVLATGADPVVRRIVTEATPVLREHHAALTAAQHLHTTAAPDRRHR